MSRLCGRCHIFPNNVEDRIKNVEKIFTTLLDAGVTIKITKSHLFQRQVECVGHMVKPRQLEIDKINVK